jgi:hypothetical protein
VGGDAVLATVSHVLLLSSISEAQLIEKYLDELLLFRRKGFLGRYA